LRATNFAALNTWSAPTTGKTIAETHTKAKTEADNNNNNTCTDAPGLHHNATISFNDHHGTGARREV
jgi:hypothetical protein